MQNPAEVLESYRQFAHRLLQGAEDLKRGAKLRPVLEEAGASLVAGVFNVRKRHARTASRVAFDLQASADMQRLGHHIESSASHVISLLKTISVRKPSLTRRGNSHLLVRKVAKATRAVKIETRIRNVAHALDDICAMDLIYNHDIPAYHDELAREKALKRRREREAMLLSDPRGFADVGMAPVNDRRAIEVELKAHPEVVKTLHGSLDALTGDSKDGPRQASASARNALERLVRDLTGEERVKDGLRRLLGEAQAKVVAKAYDAASAALHGAAPTRKVAEFNFRVVLASCIVMVHAAAQGPGRTTVPAR